MNIRTRLVVFYIILFIISTIFSTTVYRQIYKSNLLESVKSSSDTMLQSISHQVNKELETINNYSRIILSNTTIQAFFNNGSGGDRIIYVRDAERFLDELMNNFNEIESYYLIDNDSNLFYSSRLIDLDERQNKLVNMSESARWKQEITQLKGGSIVVSNGDDFFYSVPGDDVISCIRLVNDLETQLPIGILVFNVNEEVVLSAYEEIVVDTDVKVFIKDKNGRFIGNEYVESEYGVGNYYVNEVPVNNYGWSIISVTKISALDKLYTQLNWMAIAILLFNGLVILIGSAFFSSKITKPIFQLSMAMKGYQLHKDTSIYLDSNYPEFKQLQKGFNRMTADIQGLFDKLKSEQKVKRKAELKALQAQIKPHFLYNTFDSVCGLALMGDNEAIYEMMTSLGQFYRLSLSKGRELIPLAEEIEMLRHYLAIQKIRYPNLFAIHYDVDETLLKQPILKLVLQPIVENALYHGLKPLSREGNIWISAKVQHHHMEIVIEDDGVGMTIEALNAAQNGVGKSVGLGGTMERLMIYNDGQKALSIYSKKDKGTKVTITLPIKEELNASMGGSNDQSNDCR